MIALVTALVTYLADKSVSPYTVYSNNVRCPIHLFILEKNLISLHRELKIIQILSLCVHVISIVITCTNMHTFPWCYYIRLLCICNKPRFHYRMVAQFNKDSAINISIITIQDKNSYLFLCYYDIIIEYYILL